jgi:hypothetical protein
MADVSKLKDQLAANEAQRNALAAKLGPMTDDAKLAYQTKEFFRPSGRYSDTWTGHLNGVEYTDPQKLYEAAVADFEAKDALYTKTAREFNGLFPEKDALEKQIADAGSTPDAPTDKEATSNVDNAATAKQEQQPTEKTNDAPSLEEQTNKELAAAYGYTDTNVTNSDPKEFKGESGNAPPDTPDPDHSASAALPTSAEDGYQIPPDTGGGNTNSQGGGGYESTGASTRASPSTVNSSKSSPAQSKWSGPADLRVYIKVPDRFVKDLKIPEVKQAGGILFPYTPSISYDSQASYGSVNPLHSNYTQHFFKNSSISNITISGKFTVQNEAEAAVWITTVELSRLLVKMPFGKDQNAGSAPPVCRLHAYGDWIFNNVPVAVTSFKFDLPDGVDYIARGYDGTGYHTMVPTVSTFSYTLIPMYSRQEIRDFSIDEWLTSPSHIGKGYL